MTATSATNAQTFVKWVPKFSGNRTKTNKKLSLLPLTHKQDWGRKQGRLLLGKWVNRRQFEKGCGKSRERLKEWGRIKRHRTQARLYPSCLSRSLRPHRKPPTPPTIQLAFSSQTFSVSHKFPPSALRLSRKDGCIHVENEWALQKHGWSSGALRSVA